MENHNFTNFEAIGNLTKNATPKNEPNIFNERKSYNPMNHMNDKVKL